MKRSDWTNRVAHTAVIAGKPCSYKSVHVLVDNGQWISRTHVIHLNPRGEGRFPSLPPNTVIEHPPLLLVETHLLELADHAQQPG
ncbi:hypothetical protein ACYZTM_14685 [Pseudomonas sp. MDT2-39-1]|uniref:hypothetical protein n=1 Tax=Pseudomonas sp. BGI-2 TaxID=2528211 RepID=UPI00103316A9|nr:hypothetical protein [Pseudomonas sp. BGI-2]TBN36952.1 hypothetical protein EYC95_23805 [Pseudomonas sp. BGI-2]